MPNTLKVTVENADELLNAGAYDTGALIQIQSSTTETGSFTDISGTGSTPTIALVAGTRAYTGYDPVGTSTTWYKVRYKNAAGTRTSDYSAAFQVAGEAGGYLCSLYDAKQRLGIAYTDTSEDENVLGYIAQVSRWIERETGRWFTPRDDTLLFSPNRTGRVLWLPKGIRSVTTLGYASTDQPDTSGTYTTIAAGSYSVQPSEGDRDPGWPGDRIALLSTAGAYFYGGLNTVSIVGSFGWSAPPPDIEKVALNLVVAAHRERGSASDVISSDSFSVNIDGSRTYSRAISTVDWRTLEAYRFRAVV